ncbi:type II toxin-antitoxin system VapC family toxin [Methanobacterium paludis]|jgi:uncharacterized protein|uniref:VapC9 PIN-like domain-containing protein n=1 Tax=Methanobacterium paludis (strain DSM 25820 / JCM 18151 / SWAN1) TaxID=868131 RepID=F6D3W7_METPW|nr:PIN domain-containing protein [Methanobacterium paludis]AEG18769.1 hypothetical protein MSWAN_1758 [Methanobacterium paludis]
MIPAQFHVDIVGELERILPSYSLVVPSFVVRELNYVKNRSKGKNKVAASIALKIAKTHPIKVVELELEKGEFVDDALLRISNAPKKVLCTNDRELRSRARKNNINVVYLRQRRYLAVDGHLNI